MQPTSPHLLDAIPTLEADIPASSFMLSSFWLWVAIGLAVAVAAALIAFLWWRALHKRTAAPQESALQRALKGMDALEEELPALRPCALCLSMLIRDYMSGQTGDPALFETHEEFSQRMDSLEKLPESCRYETRELLDELAGYKYAAETENAPAQARALIERSRAVVTRIDDARTEAEKGGAA